MQRSSSAWLRQNDAQLALPRSAAVPRPTGLVIGAPVMSSEGDLPVEYLVPGDRVLTRTGMRDLRAVIARPTLDVAVLRIPAGMLEDGVPGEDLLLLPEQPILLRGWRAKAFGAAERVVRPAGQLMDAEFIRKEVLARTHLFELCFDEDVVIYSAGLELSCAARKVSA